MQGQPKQVVLLVTRVRMIAAVLVALASASVSAQPAALEVEGEDGLVDLAELWKRATQGVPLAQSYIEKYVSGAPPIEEEVEAPGEGIPLILPTGKSSKPPRAANAKTLAQTVTFLPIKRVSAEDAREIYRRRSLLVLYLKNHDVFLKLVERTRFEARMTDTPVTVDLAALQTFGSLALAAHAELFVLEWIAFYAGETQAEKCQARERARTHARILRLDRSELSEQISDNDFPSAWLPIWKTVRDVYAKHYAPLDESLCSIAQVVSRKQLQERLQGNLDDRLLKIVQEQYNNTLTRLDPFRKEFAEMLKNHEVIVPVEAVVKMRAATESAQDMYERVKNDDGRMYLALEELEAVALEVQEIDSGKKPMSGAFAAAEKGARDQRARLVEFIESARLLALSELSAENQARLAVCKLLPEKLANSEVDAAVVANLDECVRGAIEVRRRLLEVNVAMPQRAALLTLIQNLGSAYLRVHRPR